MFVTERYSAQGYRRALKADADFWVGACFKPGADLWVHLPVVVSPVVPTH